MNIETYKYKTKPFQHQKELFERTADYQYYALFWEQGCGKTKPVIDTCAYQYLKGTVDALLVVAPNGVHRNWITDELPAHLPDEVAKDACYFYWQSNKANNKGYQEQLKNLLKHKGLLVLTVSYEGFMTKQARKFIWKLLKQRKVFYALDEAHKIKEPKAKRTISINASGKYAVFRRLLTGTPIAKGPFDAYSQVRWLSDQFWKDRGFGGFLSFKTHFGIWMKAADVKEQQGYDPGYDQLVGYRNIEELNKYIDKVGDRLTKETAGLDLPPKLFQKRFFEMTPAQVKAYNELREEYITELESGEVVEATLAIVRLLKLQQITCNYVTTEADEPTVLISDKNPRLDVLKDITDNLTTPAIIWARFSRDIDQIMDLLGDKACRYDGKVDDEGRAVNKKAFQNGEKQFFVGNQQAGSTGLTLIQAKTVIYYSNSFGLVDRLQSEDRAHRIGQHNPVNYIDIMCKGTVDEHIVKSLRSKFDLALQITGDNMKEWI